MDTLKPTTVTLQEAYIMCCYLMADFKKLNIGRETPDTTQQLLTKNHLEGIIMNNLLIST